MNSRNKLLKVAIPLLIIVAAVAITVTLVRLKKQPPKRPSALRGALVDVVAATRTDIRLDISASGTVAARQEISLEPQVGGKVMALGKRFASGAFFQQGDLLLQLEATDYRLAVDQAEAALARAEVELATTESQAAIARDEWQRLGLQGDEEPNPLALYEPQLKNARANVASAAASLAQAKLNLARTKLTAPFDLRIRSEQVDLGQYVRAGTKVATLTATDAADVIVSLPLDDLRWLDIPGPRSHQPGNKAQITLGQRDASDSWDGHIDRALGEVDPLGRMLQVAIKVEDPYRLRQQQSRPPYLEVGMFVHALFKGPQLDGVVVLPRRALRDNASVWLADKDNLLEIRPVEIVRLEKQHVIVGKGLSEGERVILTTLTGAANGTLLRPVITEP